MELWAIQSMTHWDSYLSGYQKNRKCTIQCFVWPPLDFMTASNLLGILLINLWHTYKSMSLTYLPLSPKFLFMVFYTDTSVICGTGVQKLWKPVKKSHTSYVVPFHPVFGLSGGVLGVIVLLKNTLLITMLSFLQAGRSVVIFLLWHSPKWVLFQHISDCLWRDCIALMVFMCLVTSTALAAVPVVISVRIDYYQWETGWKDDQQNKFVSYEGDSGHNKLSKNRFGGNMTCWESMTVWNTSKMSLADLGESGRYVEWHRVRCVSEID